MTRATFDTILMMDDVVISGTTAAQAMGMHSGTLFDYARERPELIGFPVQISGKRLKVARIPFLKFWGFSDEEIRNKRREIR